MGLPALINVADVGPAPAIARPNPLPAAVIIAGIEEGGTKKCEPMTEAVVEKPVVERVALEPMHSADAKSHGGREGSVCEPGAAHASEMHSPAHRMHAAAESSVHSAADPAMHPAPEPPMPAATAAEAAAASAAAECRRCERERDAK